MHVLVDDGKHSLTFIQCNLKSMEEYIYREDGG
jgi:hypothetical protein